MTPNVGRGPDRIVEPSDPLPRIALPDLPREMRDAAERMGWRELLPVQALTIPYVLAGRDLMVQSRTGSGKTGAFFLPLLRRLDLRESTCQALVLVPTRELARQVAGDGEQMSGGVGGRVVALYGGVAYGPQLDGLRKGAHVVVGTPGRILDHLVRGTLKLSRLRVLVLDEADRMLSMGFYPDMQALRRYLPAERDGYNGYMFSATFPPRVLYLAREFLSKPEFLSLSHGAVHVAETEHVYYETPPMEKDRCLVRVIEMENPESAIVFCNTKANAKFVTVVLQRFGYDADLLSSELSQSERDAVLARVYERKLRFLVATDVAARGIDIERLSHVILYDFPDDPDAYIHRTDRTGRAGAAGEAISLVTVLETMELKRVARRFGIDLQARPLPADEDVQAVVAERAVSLLEAKLRDLDGLVRERLQRMVPLAHRLVESDEQTQILAMLLDEHYQTAFHGRTAGQTSGGEEATADGNEPPPPGRHRRRGGRGRRRS